MPNLKRKDPVKSIKIQVQQDLEYRILHGMACEWDAAWLGLDPDKQQQIRRPTFAIKELKNQWGNWSPQKREISLSRQLVLNYPWDSIRDVLLHEMAHQMAQQLWGASAQIPHGPVFKQACRLLHIDSTASANYAPLQDRLLRDASNTHDKRMLRIKKLLALAESKNRFEAEAAMTKAHELIARHNIELMQHNDERQFLSIFLGSPAPPPRGLPPGQFAAGLLFCLGNLGVGLRHQKTKNGPGSGNQRYGTKSKNRRLCL